MAIDIFKSDSPRRMATHVAMTDGRIRDERSGDHLTSERAAAVLDGRLTGDEREQAIRHLASCAECREEITELRSILDSAGASRSRWFAVAAVTAAMLVFVLFPRGGVDEVMPGTDLTRAELDSPTVLGTVSPADGDTLSQSRVQLIWRAAGAGATYLLTVQDTSGTVAWSSTTTDTSSAPPDRVRFTSGTRYFWSVDTRLADGRTAKTRVQSFTLR